MIELDNKKMAHVMSSFQIPVKPEILTEIQEIMKENEPNIEKIAYIISSDVGLSAAILKIINSPFYGMYRKISEIKQAVMMLGLKTVSGLVMALLLKKSIQGDACISIERYWDDAIDVANAITYLGNQVKNEIPIDMLYSVGLFHDCGIPLLALKYEDYNDILTQAAQNNTNSIKMEEEQYRTNHAILGYYVASSWHLPKELCQLILHHHDLDILKQNINPKLQLIYALLMIANNIVSKVRRFTEIPDWLTIKDDVLELIGLSHEDYDDLENEFFELF